MEIVLNKEKFKKIISEYYKEVYDIKGFVEVKGIIKHETDWKEMIHSETIVKINGKMNLLGEEVPCELEVSKVEIEKAFRYALQKNNLEVIDVRIINKITKETRGEGFTSYDVDVANFKECRVTVNNNINQKVFRA